MYLSHQFSLIISSLLALFFLVETNAQPAPMGSNKTVRTETCWMYPVSGGVAAKEPYCSAKIHYKRDGRKLKMTLFDETGQVTKEYHYAYAPGECETFQLLADGSKRITDIEKYDDQGNVIEHTRYTVIGNVEDKKKIEYDRKGRKKREEYFVDKNGRLERIYAVDYGYGESSIRENYTNYSSDLYQLGAIQLDENQLPKEYNKYASSGEPMGGMRYDRNPQGRLTSIHHFTSDNNISVREDYEYNGSNMHCLVYSMGGRELVEHVMYQYDYYQ